MASPRNPWVSGTGIAAQLLFGGAQQLGSPGYGGDLMVRGEIHRGENQWLLGVTMRVTMRVTSG